MIGGSLTTQVVFLQHLLCWLLAAALSGCGAPSEPVSQVVKIGLLTNNPNGLRNVHGFRDEMRALGFTEGRNN